MLWTILYRKSRSPVCVCAPEVGVYACVRRLYYACVFPSKAVCLSFNKALNERGRAVVCVRERASRIMKGELATFMNGVRGMYNVV